MSPLLFATVREPQGVYIGFLQRWNEDISAVGIAISFRLPQPQASRSQCTQGRIESVDRCQEPSVDTNIVEQLTALYSLLLGRRDIGAQHGARDGMRERFKTDSPTGVLLFCQKWVRGSQGLIDLFSIEHPAVKTRGVCHSTLPCGCRKAEYPFLGESPFCGPTGAQLPPSAWRVNTNCLCAEVIALARQVFGVMTIDATEDLMTAQDDQVAAFSAAADVDASYGH